MKGNSLVVEIVLHADILHKFRKNVIIQNLIEDTQGAYQGCQIRKRKRETIRKAEARSDAF